MELFDFNLNFKLDNKKERIIVLGKFSSFHLGHQKLLAKGCEEAKKTNKELIVMIYPNELANNFFSFADRLLLLKQYHPSYIMIFNPTLANYALSRVEFLQFLKNNLNVTDIVVGKNFNFGKNKLDDFEIMKQYAKLDLISEVCYKDALISSSKILEEIKTGYVSEIKKALGFNWFLSGEVIYGEGNGKKLGTPTANVEIPSSIVSPREGAYISLTTIDGKKYPSVSSFMKNPFFKAKNVTFETHLLNQNLDLYGKIIYVELLNFLHEPIEWKSFAYGVEALEKDKKSGREYFLTHTI